MDNRRKRLMDTVNHRIPDRVPLTFGGPSCSMHIKAYENILNYLGWQVEAPPRITDNILQIVEPDSRLLDLFDIDLVWVLPNESTVQWNTDRTSYTDCLGRRFVASGGFFNQVDHPMQDHIEVEWKYFHFPSLASDRFADLGKISKDGYDKGFGMGVDGPWGIYEISSSLIGMTRYLMYLKSNPNLIRQIAEDVLEKYLIPFYDLLLENTVPYVQVVGISDDLGTQTGMIFSPKMYREIFKPLHQRLVDHIHKRTDAKVYMHSDGSIYPIIPDLIEIGVEGLNPVQYSAKDMDLTRLKKEFGKDLGFFGGVLENSVLSFGTPDDVRRLVKENMSILSNGGGFIFAAIHNISQEVPPNNILALYEAGAEYGKY